MLLCKKIDFFYSEPKISLDKTILSVYYVYKIHVPNQTKKIGAKSMSTKTKKSGMTPLDIRNALHNSDLNQAAIARELGVTPPHISAIIDGKRVSRRVHEAIAEAIGVDIRRIWPDLYLVPGREPKIGRPAKHWNRRAA